MATKESDTERMTEILPSERIITLEDATQAITVLNKKTSSDFFKISVILSAIEKSQAYKEQDFKSTADYAMKKFGYKKSMAYGLIKVGCKYIDIGIMQSNLPHGDTDYSLAQLLRFLPLDREDVIKLIYEGKINPDMTVKQIDEVLKGETDNTNASDEDNSCSEPEEVKIVPVYESSINGKVYAPMPIDLTLNIIKDAILNIPIVTIRVGQVIQLNDEV